MRSAILLTFAAGLLVAGAGGCASAPPLSGSSGACILMTHDDGRVDGSIAFPTIHHEGIVRFELPPGAHKLRRLWVGATAPGTLRWAIYEQSPLEGPGPLLQEGQLRILPEQVSSGRDGRWVVQDLSGLPATGAVVWFGLKKLEGEPTVAASRVDAGQYFLRSHDPTAPLNLLPVRRTPLVRLEIDP
jgi:hypothetical protein